MNSSSGLVPGLQQGVWLNEPAEHQMDAQGHLRIITAADTDFWRETHYGFIRDSGHFLAIRAPASFTFQVRVRGDYQALYDQAGLMVRLNERQWIKAGIELSDGHCMISSVLTDGTSDWAVAPFLGDPAEVWMRATVAAGVLRLQVSSDGTHWPLLRLCPLPLADSYWVGPMACSPQRGGLAVTFSDAVLGPASGKDLHDLS